MTTTVLEEYQILIANTTDDLNDHLYNIDKQLQNLALEHPAAGVEDDVYIRMEEEKRSTAQCLRICGWVSSHIDQVKANVLHEALPSDGQNDLRSNLDDGASAERYTDNVFAECKDKLAKASQQLQSHLQDVTSSLDEESTHGGKAQKASDHIKEEKASLQQCISICSEAAEQVGSIRTNVFEDVSATHDAHQIAVATLGDLVFAKRVHVGDRSAQWLGQMSDISLQQLSRDRNAIQERVYVKRDNSASGDFELRHGMGNSLGKRL